MEPILSLMVRPAADTDAEFLFRAFAESRRGEFAALGWPPAQLDGFLRMQFEARSRGYASQFPAAEVLVVEYEKALAAAYTVDRSDGVTRLVDIVVLPEFQGNNIGSQLIRQLLGEGRPVELTVESGNLGARRLYERLGFVMAETGDVYHRMRWEPAPEEN